jgi:hypothetical protein
MQKIQRAVGFPELTHATKMSLQSAGKTDVAKLFSEALETTATRALSIRKAWATHAENVLVLHAPEEALSLFIEDHLTKSQHKKYEVQQKYRNATSSQVTISLKLLKKNIIL